MFYPIASAFRICPTEANWTVVDLADRITTSFAARNGIEGDVVGVGGAPRNALIGVGDATVVHSALKPVSQALTQ